MNVSSDGQLLALIGNLSPFEIVLVLVVVLLLFGAKRLPNLARDLGKGIREFKKSLSGLDEDEKNTLKK